MAGGLAVRDAATSRKLLSALIVCTMVWTVVVGFLALVPPAARAAPCDQVAVISGNWDVSTTQECVGIDFTLDGNLNILAGGNLTLRGGSLSFIEDTTRIYSANVAAGGTLILDGATLTTTPQALDAYVKLDFNLNGGTFRMRNGAILKFPGTFNSTAGSVVEILNSTITGFLNSEVAPWVGNGAPADDNDDAPTITWAASTVSIANSRIERLYEAASAVLPRTPLYLNGNTTLTAINSYIGVDFYNSPGSHNVIQASGTSLAFLLNVTIDEVQSALIPPSDWIPPYVPVATGTFYLYRWADVTVVDRNGMPVAAASVWTRQTPSGATATYPDNGGVAQPGATILGYLGKTAGTFNITDARGRARIPLPTDRIDVGTGSNSFFFGNYEQVVSYGGFSGTAPATFDAYPLITAGVNEKDIRAAIPGLALPRPEFLISQTIFMGGNGPSSLQPINTPVTISATLNNTGTLGQTGTLVSFFSANVDTDRNGVMDSTVLAYKTTGQWIGDRVVNISVATSVTVSMPWSPPGGIAEATATVSVVADPPIATPTDGGAVIEPNETNNIRVTPLTLFSWPDLAVLEVTPQRGPVVNNPTPINVRIQNVGTNTATLATVQIFEGATPLSSTVTFDLPRGSEVTKTLTWTPTAVGIVTITAKAVSRNDSANPRNWDYVFFNNVLPSNQNVLTQPDLALLTADYPIIINVTQNRPFDLAVKVHNLGLTQASGVDIAVYLDNTTGTLLNFTSGISIPAGANLTVVVRVAGIDAPTGIHALAIVVDPNQQLLEGGATQESNNFANATVNLLPPAGSLFLEALPPTVEPGTTMLVGGIVVDTSSGPLRGIVVTVSIEDSGGNVRSSVTTTSAADGTWIAQLTIPQGLAEGAYRIVARGPVGGAISPASTPVDVKPILPFLFQLVPLIGLQWWMFLAIIIAVAAVAIGVTVYFKVYGLGKMVECGECGAFIPEDSTTCPKCGVEFEREMAKCSNCQAWIPVDVKQCPECGVEFATGEVEMADYQDKMRMQYDEVVRRFRDEASRQLGHAISDRDFVEWWRKQPTFVTFEDWVREDEEMRKMGSKPCPACGTLNSVTGTVCHRCGAFLKEDKRPPSREVPKRASPGESAEEGGGEGSRLGHRKSSGPPVVRKVIRRKGEPAEGEPSQDQDGKSDGEEL